MHDEQTIARMSPAIYEDGRWYLAYTSRNNVRQRLTLAASTLQAARDEASRLLDIDEKSIRVIHNNYFEMHD